MSAFTLKCVVIAAAMALGATAAIAQNIKVGSVLSVTGPAAFLGDPELKTLQLYIEKSTRKAACSGASWN